MELYADKVLALCRGISVLNKQAISKQEPIEDLTISLGKALSFWTFDWLSRTKMANTEQVRFLIDSLGPVVAAFGFDLEKLLKQFDIKSKKIKLPVIKIGFLDRKYVFINGMNQVVNMMTGEYEALPKSFEAMETVVYNLSKIFIAYYSKYLKNQEDRGHNEQDKSK